MQSSCLRFWHYFRCYKTTLDHLPPIKQQELQDILQLIRKHSEVEMVILFGSYARGDWVEEYENDGIHFRYQSDYDLLVIIRSQSLRVQERIEWKINRAIEKLTTLLTPVSVIVHDIKFVNRCLEEAQYFFADIQKQGIMLYDSGRYVLAEARELSNAERYQLAKEDFEYWIERAHSFWETFKFAFSKHDLRTAAFLLHQISEVCYTTILLVYTRYKPNTHKIQKLRELAKTIDRRFTDVFPFNSKEDGRGFELLCAAYVDARYKKSYVITQEELAWLAERVEELKQVTISLCQEKIDSFLQSDLS